MKHKAKKVKKLLPDGRERRNIDLSPHAVKSLTIQAAEAGTLFKPYAETILEEQAKKTKK